MEWASGAEGSLRWTAEVAYYYKVAGGFYAGYNRVPFGRERDLEGYVTSYAPGTPLCVRYKPTSPEVSVVLHCDQLCRVTPVPSVCEPANRQKILADDDAGEV